MERTQDQLGTDDNDLVPAENAAGGVEFVFEDFAAELFSAGQARWCLTGSARYWTRVSDGRQLTIEETAVRQCFRPDYPFTGSWSAVFKQVADVALPPVAAAVLAGAPGLDRYQQVSSYLEGLYGQGAAATAACNRPL